MSSIIITLIIETGSQSVIYHQQQKHRYQRAFMELILWAASKQKQLFGDQTDSRCNYYISIERKDTNHILKLRHKSVGRQWAEVWVEEGPDRRVAFSSTSGGPGGWQLCPDDPLGLGVLLQHHGGSRWMAALSWWSTGVRGPSPAPRGSRWMAALSWWSAVHSSD